MTELLKVIEQNGEQIVSARDLHEFLEIGKDFSTWFKDRVEKYGFEEGLDFSPILGKTTESTGRPRKEYVVKLDMAKELSMVEGNEKGRIARKYFIECEKKLKQIKLPSNFKEALIELLRAEEEKEKLQLEINHKHNLIDKMTECYDGLVLRATCRDYINKKSKETGIHQAELYGKIYRLLGNVLKTDISYQYDKFTKEQRKLVDDNKRYNTANKLKGLDRKAPFKYTDSKMAISQIEYICDMLGHGAKLLEVMSKVFEVEITEIIDKYNFHSEKNQALMILDNKY